MDGFARARRFVAYVGVVVAAAASIATSAPAWSLDDSVDDLSSRLDTNTPQAVHHFSVASSEAHMVRVRGSLTWDEARADPQAAVRVRLESDDGEVSESTHRAPDDTSFDLALSPPCTDQSCTLGYTVTLELVDGWPDEHVDVAWSFAGEIGGEGMEEPDGAFITVTED